MTREIRVGLVIKADGKTAVRVLKETDAGLDKLNGAARRARSGLNLVSNASNALIRKLSSLQGVLVSLISARVLTGIGSSLIHSFKAQEQAVAALNQSLRSMGRTTDNLSQQLQALASEIQSRGIIGDEAIIKGQSFLTTYGKISDDLLPRATRVMADLAAKMGGDTVSAANLLGRASEGLVGELTRVGISLSDEAKKTKDFRIILRDIEAQVGGMNEALANTSTGALTQFGNTFGDLKETLGGVLAFGLTPVVQELGRIIEAENNLARSGNTIQRWGEDVGRTFAIVADSAVEIARLISAPFEIIGRAVGAQLAALNLLRSGEFRQALSVLKEASADVRRTLGDLLDPGKVGRFQAALDRSIARRRTAQAELTAPGKAGGGGDLLSRNQAGAQAGKIRSVTEELKFQLEQVRRSAREQAAFDAVRRAGIPIWSEEGKQIAALARQLFDEREARKTSGEEARKRLQVAVETGAQMRKLWEEEQRRRRQRLTAVVNELKSERQKVLEHYEQSLVILQTAKEEELAVLGGFAAARERLEERTMERLKALNERGLDSITKQHKAAFDELKSTIEGWSRSFADAMLASSGSFADFISSVQRQVARIALSKATEPLFNALAGFAGSFFSGGGGGNALANTLTSAGGYIVQLPEFGGARAGGGPVRPGRAFLVGERGPELFVPGTAGQIVPGGGAPVTVNVINNSGAPARVNDRQVDGRRVIDVLVGESVARQFGSGRFDGMMGQTFGLRRRGVGR